MRLFCGNGFRYDTKLISTKPSQTQCVRKTTAQDAGNKFNAPITRRMSEGVVELFEVVRIDDRQRQFPDEILL